MTQSVADRTRQKVIPVPAWIFMMTDEQFIYWCKQRKLQLCLEPREFPEDERASIYRYMARQQLAS